MAFDLPDAVTIDTEFRDLIPPLTEEEFGELERKLLSEGCTEPLKLWAHDDQDILIDGHHRYRICQTHGIDMPEPVYIRNLQSRTDVKIWMIRNQIGRRNLSDFARTEIALMLKPLLAEKAKQNSLKGVQNLKKGEESPDRQNSATPGNGIFSPAGRVDDQVAKSADVSRNTVQRVEKILESGNDEIIDKARSGEISINKAFKAVTPEKQTAAKEPDEPAAEPSVQAGPVAAEDLKDKSEQVLMDEAMEGVSLESLVDQLSKENAELVKKLEIAAANDAVAENLKLQDIIFGHEQRINMLTQETYEKDRQLKWQNRLLRELKKLLAVETYGEIVSAVRKLKGQ